MLEVCREGEGGYHWARDRTLGVSQYMGRRGGGFKPLFGLARMPRAEAGPVFYSEIAQEDFGSKSGERNGKKREVEGCPKKIGS